MEKLEEAAAASGKAAGSKAVERSPTTLLVKNLPYSVTLQELQVRATPAIQNLNAAWCQPSAECPISCGSGSESCCHRHVST